MRPQAVDFPEHVSVPHELKALIAGCVSSTPQVRPLIPFARLLQDADSRIGTRGPDDLYTHAAFCEIDWDNLHQSEPFTLNRSRAADTWTAPTGYQPAWSTPVEAAPPLPDADPDFSAFWFASSPGLSVLREPPGDGDFRDYIFFPSADSFDSIGRPAPPSTTLVGTPAPPPRTVYETPRPAHKHLSSLRARQEVIAYAVRTAKKRRGAPNRQMHYQPHGTETGIVGLARRQRASVQEVGGIQSKYDDLFALASHCTASRS